MVAEQSATISGEVQRSPAPQDSVGAVVWQGKVHTQIETIAEALARHAPELERAGMETGPVAVWLWHGLRDAAVPLRDDQLGPDLGRLQLTLQPAVLGMRRPRPIDFCGFPTLAEQRVSF